MEIIEQKIRYVKLFYIYKELLTYKQIEIVGDYFLADLSLGEIANSRKISRAAVDDAIKKSCLKLEEYESNLHLLEKQDKLIKITSKLKEKCLNSSEINEIKEIEKELDYGI